MTFHLSHVGSCTGRDHFSGWSLDWINLAIGYLPYLDRFYAPADARGAFIAIRDLAARTGAHLIGIPRDAYPHPARLGYPAVAAGRPLDGCLAAARPGAQALLAFGAGVCRRRGADKLNDLGDRRRRLGHQRPAAGEGPPGHLFQQYPDGIVTIEDGLIGDPATGIRGFAGIVRGAAHGRPLPLIHLGITDPRIAPSDGHLELWQYFGIDSTTAIAAVKALWPRHRAGPRSPRLFSPLLDIGPMKLADSIASMNLTEEILKWKTERKAVILAHNYQRPDVQDIADFTGDSLELARKATEIDADTIVFCGGHFLAETAAILNPGKTVLIPDARSGCPMADMITADRLREFDPTSGAKVVCCVNSPAEVKAESDCCCTSGNAVKIVGTMKREAVIFVPDQHLGSVVAKPSAAT